MLMPNQNGNLSQRSLSHPGGRTSATVLSVPSTNGLPRKFSSTASALAYIDGCAGGGPLEHPANTASAAIATAKTRTRSGAVRIVRSDFAADQLDLPGPR